MTRKNSELSIKSLRDDFILKEFLTLPIRSQAIVGAAVLEEVLEKLIRKSFVQDATIIKSSFSYEKGFLGNFAAKIQLSYLLGLISKETYNDLNCVKKIRNDFAHKIAATDFAQQSIVDECKKFIIIPKSYPKNDLNNEGLFCVEVALLFMIITKSISKCKPFESKPYEIDNIGFTKEIYDFINNN